MKRRDIINFIILIVVIAYAAISYYNKSYEYSSTEFLMDTIVDIKVRSKSKEVEQTIEETFEIMRSLETKLSCFQSESIISKFNSGEIDSLRLDNDLQKIFSISSELFLQSDSMYDISIGRLSKLWDFDEMIIPSERSITEALEYVGFNELIIRNGFIKKPAGMELNLGSLAKGFIIDKAVEYLMTHEIESGFVNAGGDIRIFGQKKALKIGIQHPRSDRGELLGTILLKSGAIVTSGDYERFFIEDGIRYHHILNPKTGYPADKVVSVTVISDQAVLADAYSTALFLLEPSEAIKLANSLSEIEVKLFYMKNGELKSLQSEKMIDYLN